VLSTFSKQTTAYRSYTSWLAKELEAIETIETTETTTNPAKRVQSPFIIFVKDLQPTFFLFEVRPLEQ
jgi:hypothetical protein